MSVDAIAENVRKLLSEIPENVELEAAAKTRSAEEIERAIRAGVRIVGENYVKEAEEIFKIIGRKARWHMIGHLQKNKVKRALEIFDMIETIDSFEIAGEVNKRAAELDKKIPVLVEINSGREAQKSGIFPEDAVDFVRKISSLKNIGIMGLMTMGPLTGDDDSFRPYFRRTKEIFDGLSDGAPEGVEMRYLSMGMTASYKVAIEEGANIVRIGAKIFGGRND